MTELKPYDVFSSEKLAAVQEYVDALKAMDFDGNDLITILPELIGSLPEMQEVISEMRQSISELQKEIETSTLKEYVADSVALCGKIVINDTIEANSSKTFTGYLDFDVSFFDTEKYNQSDATSRFATINNLNVDVNIIISACTLREDGEYSITLHNMNASTATLNSGNFNVFVFCNQKYILNVQEVNYGY